MVSKKALIIGINKYTIPGTELSHASSDAVKVAKLLERNHDGSKNFDVNLISNNDQYSTGIIDSEIIEASLNDLFCDSVEHEIALFYFSGHGFIDENTCGYLVPQNAQRGRDGIDFNYILGLINRSKSKHKIIILDCCYSGSFASKPNSQQSKISNGTTLLAASAKDQPSYERDDVGGIFTDLLVNALSGEAANLLGDITPGSVYAHIDQSLGPWEQRPVFKTYVQTFTSLRKSKPRINIEELNKITDIFPSYGYEKKLDPTFEPDSGEGIKENEDQFSILQKYRALGIVEPIGSEHMYYAAMESKSCKLTMLGEHYRRLVAKGRI